MNKFGAESSAKLSTCDPRLIRLAEEVLKHWDCAVLDGHRGKEAQDEAFSTGRSKLQWPNGNHNALPSKAMDLAPYPVIWPDKVKRPNTYTKDLARWYAFAGFVMGTAKQMGIAIRGGFDWDADWDMTDETFDDLPHFELID